MRAAILRHSKGTPPGSIIDWMKDRGVEFRIHHLYQGEALPNQNDFDLLVILGGPMNVDDVQEHPYLIAEKALIKQAVEAGKRCVGLCLGSQLLAQVLGGQVMRNTQWEVGWHEVVLETGERLRVFQWHQDMFTLPPGGQRLATNSVTANQAFTWGSTVWATQFHPEASEAWVRECAEDKQQPSGRYVQNPEEILKGMKDLAPMRKWFFDSLDKFVCFDVHRPQE